MTFPWTEKIEDEICKAIADSKLGMHALIAKNPTWPKMECIREHRIKDENFAVKYARAKQSQAEMFIEEIMEISDDSSRDTTTLKIGTTEKEVCDHEWVQRSRLKVDSRKWLASKLIPKLYGDILPKRLPIKLDLSKSFEILAQEIFDSSQKDLMTLDEAQGALDMLKKYAELTKIPKFEEQLLLLENQLNAAVLKKGEVHYAKEVDSKSDKTSGRSQKGSKSKKGKTNSGK